MSLKQRGPAIPVYLSEGGLSVSLDQTASALPVIDIEHHEIHEGEAYVASYRSPDASPVADNASLDLLIFTGQTYTHIVAKPAAGGDAEFVIYEAPTITANGTGLAKINRNRVSTNTSVNQAFHSPTVGATGTELVISFLPGGVGGNSPGAEKGERFEFILRPITYYLFRLTNRAGSAQPLSLVLDWYEHT